MKPSVLLGLNASLFASMFSPRDLRRLQDVAEILEPAPPPAVDRAHLLAAAAPADVIITSWGTPAFDVDVLAAAPALRLVCHAGGSVRPIVTPAFWARGVRITSAAAAIGYGVAEYCLGLILLASKRAFWLGQATRQGHWRDPGDLFGGWHEIYQQKIGIIGAGFVGRQLLSLLRSFTCDVLVYDPFVGAEQLRAWGAVPAASLDELFAQCRVVSLNAPTTPATIGLVRGRHFALLPPGAVFINTARGLLVHEAEFIAALQTGRFVACVDVTDPEPPAPDHPLRQLPNVWLTPHVAGAVAENQLRIGTLVVDEIAAWAAGRPLTFEVTPEKLATMA